MSYILQLNDGRTLQYPIKDIDFYPTIKGNIENLDVNPGDTIILNYNDSEFLYKVREPPAVSKNLLLTIDRGYIGGKNLTTRGEQRPVSPGAPLQDIVINVYNIRGKNIRDPPANQITFIADNNQFLETVFSGPQDSYLFLIAPDGVFIKNQNIKLVKYNIQGYERLNDFLLAKLG